MEAEEWVNGRSFQSEYMLWAKTRSRSRFNLATSGVPGLKMADLGVRIEELEINGPGGRYGYLPLLEAIGREYDVAPECIVAGGGTSGANGYAFSLLLGPGDEALVETPVYDVLPNLARFTGAKVTWCRRDPEDIARRMRPETKLVVLTNLHNPTSELMPEGALERIGEIAARNGALVLVDEVYLDCVWDERPRSAFHLGSNFVVTNSLTKVYGLSGLRCGWILAPAKIAERIWRLIDLFDNIPAHTAELLSVIAFRELPRLREKSRAFIEGNRAIYREFAGRHGYETPPYGTVAFPRITEGNSDAFCDRLRQDYETTVVPGHFFNAPGHVRISLVSPPEMLREGLARFSECLTATEYSQRRS